MGRILDIVIVGASRQGIVALETIRAQSQHKVIGFLDDDVAKHGSSISGLPILGGTEWALKAGTSLTAFVAIGNNDVRTSLGDKFRNGGIDLLNIVHPSVVMMSGSSMGTGNLLCAGAIVITGTRLENDVVINTGVSVDHDCVINTGAYLAPGVRTAGCVTVGEKVFIGVGAILGPGVVIGERSIVGAGSTVLSDIPPNVLAVGSPARVVRTLDGQLNWRRVLGGSR
jgi:sugar O-acyltransferase (sialic acid O-acetyltransferase NeuD family)